MPYDNNMSGTLFKNDEKREGKHDADYRGQCEINGQKFWMNAWINIAKQTGSKYMRIVFKEQEARSDVAPEGAPEGKPKYPELDDDLSEVPF